MKPDDLRRRLEFYQDIGVKTPLTASQPRRKLATRRRRKRARRNRQHAGRAAEQAAIILPPLAPVGDTLPLILEDIGDCRRCRLHEGRNKIVSVLARSSPLCLSAKARAPTKTPGNSIRRRAGQLLTQMFEGTAKKEGIELNREDIYICNVVKCRPPGNRTPSG